MKLEIKYEGVSSDNSFTSGTCEVRISWLAQLIYGSRLLQRIKRTISYKAKIPIQRLNIVVTKIQ